MKEEKKVDQDLAYESSYKTHLREAYITLIIFLCQAFIMITIVYFLGYKTTVQKVLDTLVFGLPAWYIYGALLPSLFFLIILWLVITKFFSKD